MSISFGSAGSSANVNTNLMSRTADTDTIGQVDLLNPIVASGSSILNIQRVLNSYAAFMGASTLLAYNETPTWLSDELGTINDTLKERIEAIDAAFDDLTSYIIDASSIDRGAVSTGAQSFSGVKTFVTGLVSQTYAWLEGQLRLTSEANTDTGSNITLATPIETIVRVEDALTSVEGISAPAFDMKFWLINDSGGVLTILNLTGTAANQIDTGSGDDLEVQDGGAIGLLYDLQGLKWRVIGGGGAGGAGGGLPTRQTFAGTSIVATDSPRQVWVYNGVSSQTLASIDTTALQDQAEIELTGSDNTNTLIIEHNDASEGFILNGNKDLGQYSKLVLRWDSTFDRFIEVSYNGL